MSMEREDLAQEAATVLGHKWKEALTNSYWSGRPGLQVWTSEFKKGKD